jgi:serine/threonine protein kinase
MTCCLNPDCHQPFNADDTEYCASCGSPLIALLRDRYRVERPLGQGGFGKTYLAVDRDRLGVRCVIKQFSPSLQGSKGLEKAVQLFEQEAVRLHELGEHPHIPALLAYFEHNKRLYLVQQYIEGQDLHQEMHHHGAFNERKIREVLARILPVLKYVHEHQVIHRDITPANIIRRNADQRLVLIDFGVAKLLSADNGHTHIGTKIGTEGYAPMEQLRSGKAYPASDLYSLAATCLYLMTQIRPDDLYDPLEGRWLWRDRLQQRGGQISDPLAQILDKMLKDSVNERYQSAADVIQDLKPVLATPPPPPATPAPLSGPSASGPPPRLPAHVAPSSPTVAYPKTVFPLPLATPEGEGVSRTQGQAAPLPTPTPPRSSPPTTGIPETNRPLSGSNQARQSLYTLTGHFRWVVAVALNPAGTQVASGGLDDTIRLWNAQTGELLQVLTGHRKPVNSLAFSPNGQWLVSSSDDNTIRVWTVHNGTLLRELTGHTRDVNSVAIHAEGKLLVSGGEDRSVRVWNLQTGELLRVFSGMGMGMVRSIAISPDAQRIASGSFDHQIKLWDLNTGELARPFIKGHFNAVNALVMSPNGRMLISASKDKTIKVWDLTTGETTRVLAEHTDAVNALAIAPDGEFLVSGSSDKTVRLWSLSSGKVIRTFNEHANAVNAVAISRDRRMIVSGGSDNAVKIWQI